jgi:hypothetical protein
MLSKAAPLFQEAGAQVASISTHGLLTVHATFVSRHLITSIYPAPNKISADYRTITMSPGVNVLDVNLLMVQFIEIHEQNVSLLPHA